MKWIYTIQREHYVMCAFYRLNGLIKHLRENYRGSVFTFMSEDYIYKKLKSDGACKFVDFDKVGKGSVYYIQRTKIQ